MKFLVLTLVVSSSALLGPKKSKFDLMSVQASTTRSGKQFCTNGKDIEQGRWVSLKEGEYAEAPLNSGCNPAKMMWEPNTCKLPYHSDETSKKAGRVVFVGDSITDTSARSFAWFHDKLWAKDLNGCKYEKADLKTKVRPQLLKAGFNSGTVADTVKYMEEQGFNRNHHWWGCNTSVSYVPTDKPPPASSVKAFMFALKNFGEKELGSDDTIVLNWGMWAKNETDSKEFGEGVKALMKEYAQWEKAKTAPKLIWREVSPTHWGANTFEFNKKDFASTQTSKGCAAASGPKQIEGNMKNKDKFPLKNTMMFRDAVNAAGMKIDGANIEFLPIWRGTAERAEDHQPLTAYQIKTGATIDCTHWCTHGNVNRFWNSALTAVISGMKEKDDCSRNGCR